MIVVHDPQPVAIRGMVETTRPKWVWRCHIDLSEPNPQVLDFLAAVDRPVRRQDLPHAGLRARTAMRCGEAMIWPPAIDPLAPKNMALAQEDAAYIVDQFGVDVERPMMLQVSRFDPGRTPRA